jgi:hypothetical protein
MTDLGDSRRRAGLIGSDAEQVADVWGAARRELKSKERDLAAAQARQLAEASLARSANSAALRDTVGRQLDEERDRGRFLELQLAELVAQHEHLKAQYGDTLTKLSEALQVRGDAIMDCTRCGPTLQQPACAQGISSGDVACGSCQDFSPAGCECPPLPAPFAGHAPSTAAPAFHLPDPTSPP